MITEDYLERTAGKTEEEKAQNMQEIWDWVENQPFSIGDIASNKSITARMIGTQTQLTNLVRLTLCLPAP